MKIYFLLFLSFISFMSFSQYCTPSFPSGVEPICRVIFNTFDNESSCLTSGSIGYENFTNISTTLLTGQTYIIYVYGNTNGNYTNHINVYIDWNENGILNDPGESYYLGTIVNCSNCYVSGNIVVPNGISGPKRMRVIKKYNVQANPCNTDGYGQAEDYTLIVINNNSSAQFLFHNYPAAASIQTAFNHIRLQTTSPIFTISSNYFPNYNTIQLELNTKPDFSGIAHNQTFTGIYISGTKYDLTCNNLNPPLPTTETTYYVRGRVSNNNGASWSSWSNQLWVFTYGDTYWGWHFTAKPQFDIVNKTTTPYGNHIASHDNNTSSVTHDDYFYLPIGKTITRLVTAADQALTEGTAYYSGASHNCITVGYYNPNIFTSYQDYHGFRFQNTALPKNSQILTAIFRPYAHDGSGCGGSPNTTNELKLIINGVAQDNCNSWSNSTDINTGQPRYRVRGTQSVTWNIPSGTSQQWSTGLLIQTAPDISNIIQEIINRPGYQSGNAIGLIVDHNGSPGPLWRYFATMLGNTAYRAYIEATFTNYENTIVFPTVALAQYKNASHWDKLLVSHNITCVGCLVEYQVRNAQTHAIIATGNSTNIDLNNSNADSVNVVVRLSRTNNSPIVMDLTLTVASILNPPVAEFSASATSICAGQCINFTDLSTNNPTSWQWFFNGGVPASSNQQNPNNICFNSPGTYTIELTVTNSDGHDTETKTNYITVHPNPTINLGNDTIICQGSSIVLNAGAGYQNYSWNPPSGNVSNIVVNSSGIYSVTVTDEQNCQGSDAIQVTVINQADATITTSQTIFCTNDPPIQFTAVDQGGSWSGQGISSTGLFNPAIAGTGVYTITYTIAGMCGDTDDITVTVHQAPIVDLGNDITECEGTQVILDAGNSFSSYLWSSNSNNQFLYVYLSGNYSVTVTDANNCSASDNIFVEFLPQADATINTTQTEFCLNDQPIQFISAQSGGIWSGEGINSSGVFNPSLAGIGMHLIYYAIFGQCGDVDSLYVTVNPIPSVSFTFDNESCIDANDGWAVVLITGGTPPYSINWINGSSNDTISNLIPDQYSVIVSDSRGCNNNGVVNIEESNEECLPTEIYVPNVFSPNGDGENDLLYVHGNNIRTMKMTIYNRWGQKIFETTNQKEGWDGTNKGKLLLPGSYVYFLEYTLKNGSEHKMSGNITLVR